MLGAQSSAAPYGQSIQPPSTAPSRSLLPLLGALLVIMLLAGVVLAARGSGQTAATVGQGATHVPSATQGAPAATLPTSTPAQPSTPNNATPSIPDDPFAELRTALESGRADGRVGPHGDELLAALSSGQQALATGDTNVAVQYFTAMQQILLDGTHDGSINAGMMIETMKRIQALAKRNGLTLPLSIQFD